MAQLKPAKRLRLAHGEQAACSAGFFPSGLRPMFKIAPNRPRTSGEESESQRRGFDLPVPQWFRGLRVDHDSIREASAQVRLRPNTRGCPWPLGGAPAESITRARCDKGADSWAVPPSVARRYGCSESGPAYIRDLREPREGLHRAASVPCDLIIFASPMSGRGSIA